MFADFKTSFPQVTIFSLNIIPVPDLKNNLWNSIIPLVDEILTLKQDNHNADTTPLESGIDQVVYKLFDLTEGEIRIVGGVE